MEIIKYVEDITGLVTELIEASASKSNQRLLGEPNGHTEKRPGLCQASGTIRIGMATEGLFLPVLREV
jgi:hypothetical protein